MNIEELFMLSVVMSFIAFGTVAMLFIWPRLRLMSRENALTALIAPHAFRFLGLSFLVPGVVSPLLSSEFSIPAAYGDLVAAALAIVTLWALAVRTSWSISLAWVFNLWGSADLLHALYLGQIGVHIPPGSLGAAYFIPTLIVPALLITHGLIYWVLLRPKQECVADLLAVRPTINPAA